jgi:hypothetical protein
VTEPLHLDDDFLPLLDAMCDGCLTEAQTEALIARLDTDPALCDLFAQHVQLRTNIRFLYRANNACDGGLAQVRAAIPATAHQPSGICLSTFPDMTGVIPANWPMAYMLATVIMGIGLVIGAFTYVSQSERTASPRVSPPPALAAHRAVVGRITGLVDCRCSDRAAAGRPVSLGDRFDIHSGLLELTYDTGAKVILQGPVTYEIESPAGGYLSVGRLTAKLEKKSEVRGQRSESANQKSEIRDHQFAVRTPTALVTDLGTEFGVEVSKSGGTSARVFRGAVNVQPASDNGEQQCHAVRLTENESVLVEERAAGMEIKVWRGMTDDREFVRIDQFSRLAEGQRLKSLQRWQAYSRQLRKDPTLVAYYTFESVGKDSWLLPNMATTGAALDGQIEGPLWTSGRLPGKLALFFRGRGTNDKVVLPEQERFNFTGPFSLGVWFQAAPFSPDCISALIAKGGPTWRLERFGTTNCLTLDTIGDDALKFKLLPHTQVTDRRWHLVVAVVEPRDGSHHKRLYLDGRLEAENEIAMPLARSDEPVWLGAMNLRANREFEGRIDEAMIFARALPVEEIAAMFQAGTPTQEPAHDATK